jgi:uncharacterized cupredoxin-like copper-binding protein
MGACSSSEPATAGDGAAASTRATTVSVALRDFAVATGFASVPAGVVTFAVQNAGAIPHEFVVVKSDLAPDKLPQFEQKLVDEKQLEVVSRTQPVEAGGRQDLRVSLQPGRYVLLCNVASHYVSGMFAAFEVGGSQSPGTPSDATPAPGAPAGRSGSTNDGY